MTKSENELLFELLQKKEEELSHILETGYFGDIDLNRTAEQVALCMKIKSKFYNIDDKYDVIRGLK